MGRGGKRPGAGRPPNTGKYGEPTKAVRLPVSLADQLIELLDTGVSLRILGNSGGAIAKTFKPTNSKSRKVLPLYLNPVAAGIPALTEDHIEAELDLNDYLIKHPTATFLVRVMGDSMIDAGIHPDDILVVDRAVEPKDQSIVIAVVNSDCTLKRLRKFNDKVFLMPENKNYEPLQITEEMDFMIWGVVTNIIHSL